MPSGAVPAITAAAAQSGRRHAARSRTCTNSAIAVSAAMIPTTTPYGWVYVLSTSSAAVPAQKRGSSVSSARTRHHNDSVVNARNSEYMRAKSP